MVAVSNLWLYRSTTLVPDALTGWDPGRARTDWGPSGTKNLLGEIKVARIWSDKEDWGLTDADLVRMITAVPGDALARSWQVPVGRLVEGGLGDVTVLRAAMTTPGRTSSPPRATPTSRSCSSAVHRASVRRRS